MKKTEKSKQGAVRTTELDNDTQKEISIALTEQEAKPLKAGEKVKLKEDATIWNSSARFPEGIYAQEFSLLVIRGKMAVLSANGRSGNVAGATDIENLVRA